LFLFGARPLFAPLKWPPAALAAATETLATEAAGRTARLPLTAARPAALGPPESTIGGWAPEGTVGSGPAIAETAPVITPVVATATGRPTKTAAVVAPATRCATETTRSASIAAAATVRFIV
jgi:hypothetical protein